MKINIYSLFILCLLTSCYTYKSVPDQKEVEAAVNPNVKTQNSAKIAEAKEMSSLEKKKPKGKLQEDKKVSEVIPKSNSKKEMITLGIKDKLVPSNIYKIKVGGKRYKIQVDQWENDSLVAHYVKKPEEKLKFHKNQIDEESILEKRFSNPISDIITVTIYAGIIAIIAVLAL